MVEAPARLDYRAIIDGMGQGILLFETGGKLLLDNLAARAILGANLVLVRSEGWPAMALLLDGPRDGGPSANELRDQALRSATPIRFHTYFAGAYTPCWIASIHGAGGTVSIMITIDQPDWEALTELMTTFRNEARMSISATRGHAELVTQLLRKSEDETDAQALAQRVIGFTEIIATHMFRLQNLMELLHRLEIIRIGELSQNIRKTRKKINLADFVEDFLEEMIDNAMADPDMREGGDLHDRVTMLISDDLYVRASPMYLNYALRDILRNAVCYSPPNTPIELRAFVDRSGQAIQLDFTDDGYGVRERESERVFTPFQRARQPQIIGVDGYGLSLYLNKAEIEAMGGHIWFESEENVGSIFSFKLPRWSEDRQGDR